MIRKICTLLFFFILISAGGCTQNNGYIGPVFGSWSLVEISEDGEPLPLNDETVFSFQNEVVQVMRIISSFDREFRYGNFSISDDVMSFRFIKDLSPDGKGQDFLMPSWLYFPDDEMPLRFQVKELKGNRMVLEHISGGSVLTYKFNRTW